MTVVRGSHPDDPIEGYVYNVSGEKTVFLPDEIIHIRYANPLNPFRGLPPLRAAHLSVTANLWHNNTTPTFFVNSAEPRGHYEVTEGNLTEPQRKRFQGDHRSPSSRIQEGSSSSHPDEREMGVDSIVQRTRSFSNRGNIHERRSSQYMESVLSSSDFSNTTQANTEVQWPQLLDGDNATEDDETHERVELGTRTDLRRRSLDRMGLFESRSSPGELLRKSPSTRRNSRRSDIRST